MNPGKLGLNEPFTQGESREKFHGMNELPKIVQREIRSSSEGFEKNLSADSLLNDSFDGDIFKQSPKPPIFSGEEAQVEQYIVLMDQYLDRICYAVVSERSEHPFGAFGFLQELHRHISSLPRDIRTEIQSLHTYFRLLGEFLQAGTESANYKETRLIADEISIQMQTKNQSIAEIERFIKELLIKEESGQDFTQDDMIKVEKIVYARRNLIHAYVNLPDFYKIIFDGVSLKGSIRGGLHVTGALYSVQGKFNLLMLEIWQGLEGGGDKSKLFGLFGRARRALNSIASIYAIDREGRHIDLLQNTHYKRSYYKLQAATALYLIKFSSGKLEEYIEVYTIIKMVLGTKEITDTERSMLMEAEVLLSDKIKKSSELDTQINEYHNEVARKKDMQKIAKLKTFVKLVESIKNDTFRPQILKYLNERNNRFFLGPIIEYFRICEERFEELDDTSEKSEASNVVMSLLIEIYEIISGWSVSIGNKDIILNSAISQGFLNTASNFLRAISRHRKGGSYGDLIRDIEQIVEDYIKKIQQDLNIGIKSIQKRFGGEVNFLQILPDGNVGFISDRISVIDLPTKGVRKKEIFRTISCAGEKYKVVIVTKSGTNDTEYVDSLILFIEKTIMVHVAKYFLNARWKQKIEKFRGELTRSIDEIQARTRQSLQLIDGLEGLTVGNSRAQALIGPLKGIVKGIGDSVGNITKSADGLDTSQE